MDARNQLLGMAAQDKRLVRVRPNGLDDVPQYRTDVDWEKRAPWALPIDAIHRHAFGGLRQRLRQ